MKALRRVKSSFFIALVVIALSGIVAASSVAHDQGTINGIRQISGGSCSDLWVFAPDDLTAYCIDTGTFTPAGTLTAVNLATKRRTVVPVGPQLTDIGVTPNDKFVYVTSNGTSQDHSTLYELDASTDKVISSIDTGASASAISFSPDGTEAYLASTIGLTILNVRTNRVERSVLFPSTGLDPDMITVSPSGRYAYLASGESTAGSRFWIVNLAQDRLAASVAQRGLSPYAIAVAPDGSAVYESFGGSAKVIRVLNPETGATTWTIPLAARGLAFSRDSAELIAAGFESPTQLFVIDADSRQVIHLWSLGVESTVMFQPTLAGLSINGSGSTVYAGAYVDPRIYVIPLPERA